MIKSLWQKAWPHVLAISIFLVIAVVYCKPALQGKVLNQSDVQHWKGMAQQSFDYKEKNGHFPLWTNSAFSGMPTYNIAMESPYSFNPTIGFLHNYVFTLGLPKPVNFFFLACLMTYLLLMVAGVSPWIGILGAISYAYSTYDPIIVAVGHDTKMICIAYAPAVLAGLWLIFKKRYLTGTVLLSLFAAMIIWQTHIQVVYYTFILALFAGAGFLIQAIVNKETKHAVIATALAAVSGLIALGVNSANIWPVNELSKETMRGGRSELTDTTKQNNNKSKGGLDKDYAFLYGSYGIAETFTFIVPGMYGGSNGGTQLKADSKFAEKLMETFQVPEETAIQYANGSAYWGKQPSHSGPVYLGAIICLLFITGMVFLKGWLKWALVAVSAFAVVLAWGKNVESINFFLFDHLPMYNKFRGPALSLVIPQLVFVLVAAMVLQEIFFGNYTKEELWKKLKLSGMITGGVFVLLFLMYFSFDYASPNDAALKDNFTNGMLQQQAQGQQPTPQMQQQAQETARSMMNSLKDDRQHLFFKDLIRSLFLAGAVFALLWAYSKNKLKREYVLAGIILLGSFDLLQIGKRYLNEDNFIENEQLDSIFTPSQADLQIKQDKGFYRVCDQSTGDPFTDARTSYFHNSLGGYSPAKLALYQDIISRQLQKGNMRVFDMLNTKYFIMQNPQTNQPVAQQNPGALGNCWFVKQIIPAKNADDEMSILDNLNTKDSVVIDDRFKTIAGSQPQYDSAATIVMKENLNDKIVYESNAASNQFAVFSEVYYPNGWDAYIDGKKVEYCRVNYVLRGMPVPAGKHAIEFRFEPSSYYLGNRITLWLSILIYVMLAAAFVYEWRRKKA